MSDASQGAGRLASHYICLVLLAGLCLLPIWVMIATSFKDQVMILDGRPIWFFSPRPWKTTNTLWDVESLIVT